MKRKILQILLYLITKKIINKYNPFIIGVTGSVGKTSTKNAIAILLKKYFSVRESYGNLNTEIGVPLVFIGKKKKDNNSFFSWLQVILFGIKIILFKIKDYPQIIIVEMGADKPKDISYLTEMVKINIGVITFIGDNPVHLENYSNLQELILEKSQIIRKLNKNDYAILNFDDDKTKQLIETTKAKVISFGFNEKADVRINNFDYFYQDEKIKGIVFDIFYKNKKETIHLLNCLGKSFAYNVAAAIACAVSLGIDFSGELSIFKDLKPEKSRMNLIKSKNSYDVIDDTYNSSPASVKMALQTISCLPGQRKIVVLGDMKELGDKSKEIHRQIGELVFSVADVLITVGEEAYQIKQKLIEMGFNVDNVYSFKESKQAAQEINNIIKSGDLIFVKGSRSMEMEEIVKVIV